MPIHPVTLASPPALSQPASEAAYSSHARRRLASLLRLKYLELRAEHLEYVRCVITHHLDRGHYLDLELAQSEQPDPTAQRTNPCQEAL